MLKERVAQVIANSETEPVKPLHFLSPDCQEFGLPDLSRTEGHQQIEALLAEEIELLILDNLSSLVSSGRENDAESWTCIQEWLLKLRAHSKSVLLIHHSGKSGSQIGTSKREDVLDTVL